MNRARLFGNLLLAAGLVCLLLAALAYYTDLFASDRVLPQPVALAGDGGAGSSSGIPDGPATLRTEAAPPPTGAATAEPALALEPTAVPTETPWPTPSPTPVKPGVPIRLTISSIGVDSKVEEAGTYTVAGMKFWTTLPFVVAHYNTTAKAGAKGNAVFSGHVTSRDAGNVFSEMYLVQLGDEVHIFTVDSDLAYVVTRARVVLPDEISVMDPTPDETATLITCAGEWNPTERSYSQRLIVTAKLKR